MSGTEIRTTIFLTGFMGSGKSTIGPILANTLGYSFVDLDSAVEEAAGRTITEIFRAEGEAGFRILEQKVLGELAARRNTVIALGGGTIVNPDNLTLMRQSGVLVYLKITSEQLFQRVKRKQTRPMLTGFSGENLDDESLMGRVAELVEQRGPLYQKADIIVESGTSPVGRTVDSIVHALGRFLR